MAAARATRVMRSLRFNGPADHEWFFTGTFAANVLACLLNGVLGMLLLVLDRPSDTITIIFSGIGTGFNGCLSTVSTFVSEIRKLTPQAQLGKPPTAKPLFYASTTISVGLGLFLVVFGPAKAAAA